MTRARLLNLLGIAIGIAGIAFVAVRVARDRDEIADALAAADVVWLVAAVVSGLAAMTLIGVNWLWIIRSADPTDAAVSWRRGLAWFFVGQLGKYVPGGIWPIVGQAELAHRGTVPRAAAYSSTALSMAATFFGAACVAAVTGLIAPPDARWIPLAIAIALVVGILAFASSRIRAVINRVTDRLVRRELRLPSPRWAAVLVARHLPVWVLFSGMNVLTVVALGTTLDAELTVQLIYVTCISWMGGFVIIGLPGGIGVREAIFISMMTAPLGAGVAVSVAVVSRVVSIVVDLLGAAVAVPIARTAPPAARGEADGPAGYAAP